MITVLIAGIGGASLGMEIAKALRLAGGYIIIGCDISSLAYGHYGDVCDKTLLVSREGYIGQLSDICRQHAVQVIIPGADQTTGIIAAASAGFLSAGIRLGINSAGLVPQLMNKAECFSELRRLGFAVPRTVEIAGAAAIAEISYPCIIKPSIESGGSSFVFYARDRKEMEVYAAYLTNSGKQPIIQEYIPLDSGEFTVGVLSDTKQTILGAVAMKRAFPAKLSIGAQGSDFMVSSGFSQGYIGDFPEICSIACDIAQALGSEGPLNIQGRIDREGRFLPFEINPRFSASTYLRALAGFNEVDHYIRHLLDLPGAAPLRVTPGWYLRSLTEIAVAERDIVS
jgi:carbamoyl-phosphate synthase large subunit